MFKRCYARNKAMDSFSKVKLDYLQSVLSVGFDVS